MSIYAPGLLAGMLALPLTGIAAEVIEEITIQGKRDERNLQMAINHAEDDFYDILNGMPYDATPALMRKNAELRNKTRELLELNSELRNAASRLSGLVTEYKDKYAAPDGCHACPR